jgi:hypothetical protein
MLWHPLLHGFLVLFWISCWENSMTYVMTYINKELSDMPFLFSSPLHQYTKEINFLSEIRSQEWFNHYNNSKKYLFSWNIMHYVSAQSMWAWRWQLCEAGFMGTSTSLPLKLPNTAPSVVNCPGWVQSTCLPFRLRSVCSVPRSPLLYKTYSLHCCVGW